MSSQSTPKAPFDGLWWLYWILFFACLGIGGIVFWLKQEPPLRVPVLTRDVVAFHVIAANDVTTKELNVRDVLSDTVRDSNVLVGAVARRALSADTQISRAQIVTIPDPALISDTLAVAIPADRGALFGETLRAGDVVTLATVPLSDTTSAATSLFDHILVLDVQRESDAPVVVVAIPKKDWQTYLNQTQNARVVLARKIE